jgi:FkbM family methyltransferase
VGVAAAPKHAKKIGCQDGRLAVAMLRKLNEKFLSYLREVFFISRNCVNWRSRITLFVNTIRFHLGNWLKKSRSSQDVVFSTQIKVGSDSRRVELRRFAGDIFVLYEVLCDKCYFIPPSMLPPENVRIVVDCGANVGITSLFFAAQYRNARIYSIEPDPDNFALLKRNVCQERRILPICGAIVGYQRKEVYLTTDAPAWGNSIGTNKDKNTVAVKAHTIDEICRENELTHIDLLKVDIEGAEKELFANAHFLERVGCGIVELHNDYGMEALRIDAGKWGFCVVDPARESDLKMITIWPKTRLNCP